jgi:geranylgeranyl pyrophosphate synthase
VLKGLEALNEFPISQERESLENLARYIIDRNV